MKGGGAKNNEQPALFSERAEAMVGPEVFFFVPAPSKRQVLIVRTAEVKIKKNTEGNRGKK